MPAPHNDFVGLNLVQKRDGVERATEDQCSVLNFRRELLDRCTGSVEVDLVLVELNRATVPLDFDVGIRVALPQA